jgi:hypothetical protein
MAHSNVAVTTTSAAQLTTSVSVARVHNLGQVDVILQATATSTPPTDRAGAFRDLTFPRLGRRSGGGDTTPPVITDETWDDVDDILGATVDEAGTAYALWSTSATLTNAQIIADATTIQAIAAGVNYIDFDNVPVTPGTYYLQWGVQSGGGFTQGTPVMQVVSAPGYTETWAGFTVGDTNAQITAGGYTFSASTPPNAAIVTNANAVSGKGLTHDGTTASVRWLYRNDIAAAIALGGWSEVDVLIKIEAAGANGWRGGYGIEPSVGTMSGLRLEIATGTMNARYMVDTSPNTAGGTILETGIALGGLRWCRMNYYNTDRLRVKWWTDGASEPGTWQADLTAAAAWSTTLTRIALINRVITTGGPVNLGYSVNLNAPAPGF